MDVVTLATPDESVPVPSDVDPLVNCTVPVGVPDPGLTAPTVAVIVTGCPKTGDAGDEVTVVLVDACPTVTGVAPEVWPAKLVSPKYCAVIELLPNGIAVVEMLPVPLASMAMPSDVVPLKN